MNPFRLLPAPSFQASTPLRSTGPLSSTADTMVALTTHSLVSVFNEWDPLQECIVGVAEHSMFPFDHQNVMNRIMPPAFIENFKENNPFPPEIVANAKKELDNFANLLESYGVEVLRPTPIDWSNPEHLGYTSSMVRDSILSVGNQLIEAPMALRCRRYEYLAYEDIFKRYSSPSSHSEVHRRVPYQSDANLFEGGQPAKGYTVNDNRPAFDAADFLKIGKNTLLGQLSNVTNLSGVALLEKYLEGTGFSVHLLQTIDPHRRAKHIDATFMPLRDGLGLYNPELLTVDTLEAVPALKGWTFLPRPTPGPREWPPLYMTSRNLNMNLLVLDGQTVFIEAKENDMAELLSSHGMTPVRVPFQHINCLGGSLHCATVDIRRVAK